MHLASVSGNLIILCLSIVGIATSVGRSFQPSVLPVHGPDIGPRTLQAESENPISYSRTLLPEREPSKLSPRCANRDEWKGECKWWSSRSSERYVEVTKLTGEGIGANLWKIAKVYQRAIDFNLSPVLVGPFVVGHDTGDIGDWAGFTGNPAVAPNDPAGLRRAQRHRVPLPDENEDYWLMSQLNRTSVVYVPDMVKIGLPGTWGGPWAPPVQHCRYAWQALRSIFWGVPHKRDRCNSIILRKQAIISQSQQKCVFRTGLGSKARPWVIGVHVRRGDIIMRQTHHTIFPHIFFVAAVRSVLLGIIASDPGACVIIFIFSEGPKTLEEKNMILDENASPVEWNIPRDDCQALNLQCTQIISLNSSVFNTLDCLAVADVVIGSKSGLSESAAALSTNVKIMPSRGRERQDRVQFNMTEIILTGVVNPSVQAEVNNVMDDWKHCSAEARSSSSTNQVAAAARTYYQTVDMP